ncbi:hypothetical protein DICPUDRAFT_80951 [Dictyostelium purpureum]|uniref:EGF-like domain-containing protein n=1 Tax=Dictyostelium purpureum TaxID=5786 RepID=F0ZS13_DICPU|nr:uncharacterized protein DICPUDRAFT_80951 [Dictyostelium purpureum]EGC33270.1 hypothetical protein DICPUDRAFT_80951 [Dictyostelium purpureum]|eukprot:XP_003290217.1 hypothetical protein DICPUDRAFT_80951 [Dictyostelium purpureum]
MIKKIFVLLFIFIFKINNSQIIYNNGDIKLYDYPSNVYSSYGTKNGNTICNNDLVYWMPSNTFEIKDIQPNIPFTRNTKNVLVFTLNTPVSSNIYKFNLIITNTSSLSESQYTINFLCESIDTEKLQIKALFDKPLPDKNTVNFYYIYVSIKDLKYPLDLLATSPTFSNEVINTERLNKELYNLKINKEFEKIIDVNIIINISIQSKQFSITLKPIYQSSSYQLLKVKSFPSSLAGPFIYYPFSAPGLFLTSNLTNSNSMLIYNTTNFLGEYIKKIGQQVDSNGNLLYTYIAPFNFYTGSNGDQKYFIKYNNGPNLATLENSIEFEIKSPQSPLQSTLRVEDTFSHKIGCVKLNCPLNSSPIKYQYFGLSFEAEYPYGIVEGSPTEFTFKSFYHFKLANAAFDNALGVSQVYTGINYNAPLDEESSTDTLPPTIYIFELEQIIANKYLLRVGAQDQTSISTFLLYKRFGYETLVSGDSKDGIFEMIIDIFQFNFFSVYDYFSNKIEMTENAIAIVYPNNIPLLITPKQVPYVDFIIEDVRFLKNDIDILNQPSNNSIYFYSSNLPKDYPITFQLLDTISYYDQLEGFIQPLPVKWSSSLQLFYCNFMVPKNTDAYEIDYEFKTPYTTIKSAAYSPLRVAKTNYDNDGPMITKITNANTFEKTGWRITITDETNGFSNGYIKAIGLNDFSIFTFNFTFQNATSGTIFNGVYDIIINVHILCTVQEYEIDFIYLEDTGKRFSQYSKFGSKYIAARNPFRNLEESIEDYKTMTICSIINNGTRSPDLLSFNYSKNEIDVGGVDRTISFWFTAEDTESGLMPSQKPKVYLTASDMQLLQCESIITEKKESMTSYQCDIEVPLGFGYPNDLLVSVHGFINNGGFYSGFSNDADVLIYHSRVKVIYSMIPMLISYEPVYIYSTSDIVIYGKSLKNTISTMIKYSNNVVKSYKPSRIIGETVLIIKRDESIEITGPFRVTAISQSNRTNIITIYPIDGGSTGPMPPTTNKPQKCQGTPPCGGPSRGHCVENQGCVCNSPYVGIDCSSQVIIVPKPSVNNTEPTVQIPINDDDEVDNVLYNSLVSIVSIREISNINNSAIGTYNFDKWYLKPIDQSTNQYYTNLTISSQTVHITATLKWFENITNINFANQNLTMNPSSIKYTIEISNYPFENRINSLQLIMSASFISSKTKDTCSLKEFDETTSGDNSNYLKIQIENKSLYGRFIKRAIINDGAATVSLQNDLIDSEMNTITNPHQIQTYIGILMPWFENNIIIDPDFSVLVDSNSASLSSNSTCANNDQKLSNTKIAGIAIGCAAFTIIAVVSVIYIIHKKKVNKRFLKNIDVKLKDMQ